MTKLAASSGTIVFEAGNKLYISKRPATWTSTFLFVCGLLSVILLGNGVLQLTVLKDQATNSSTIGLALLLAAALFIIIFWRVILYRKKINALSFDKLQTICILDFENNKLLDGNNNTISPLNQAWLTRKMQLTSSSPELILHWNSSYFSLVKGNPFSGGIGEIEKVLLSKGMIKK